ncbi:LXG domain of WXG superfamily protein [Terribacillus halophilus]|uniref:LXG domain of WXG superfamily protein n=1 Tax=Terribacillus halophilus TaxID=361279 RepID=A0A1G6L116_9BACI|nr:LXG domain-containing protein [Terribacillus halophilus]SDC36415.1 LXG domain of WXG superfamily protein [Terribacillus halophilus]
MKEFSVKEIHKGTETSKLDLDTLSEQLSNLQQKIRNLYNLDDALKGETGKAIRSFYNEIHTPFLTFLLQSMEDYKNRLENMKNDVLSFEPSHQGYISESFLDDELHPGLDEAKSKVASVTENINSVLSGVADITYVAKISYSDFQSNIEEGKRQIDDVISDLGELDSKHASHLQETQSDLETMKKYLSEMTTGLSSGAISISEFDTASLQDMNAYNNVIQQSYGNGNVEITEENIEYLPMAAIASATKNAEKGMDEGPLTILQHAYKSLVKGEITRKEYNDILSTASKKNGSNTEKTDTFIEYTNKNWDKIGLDVAKDGVANGIEQLGIFIEKSAHSDGMKLVRDISSGAVGITTRTARGRASRINNKFDLGSKLASGGKFLGRYGLPAATAVYGTYEDVTKKDKTGGEAITHNGASFLAGAAGSTLGTIALTAVVSNPGGWVIGAVIGGAALGSNIFNYMYDNNVWGLQDGLDSIGGKLDGAWNATVDHVNETVDSIGGAIKDGIESLSNPISWGRWIY